MQENRSFDHYYGTLSGVRGFSDTNAARLPNGRPVFYQPDPANPDGFLLPYRLNTTNTAAQAVPSLSHDWGPQHSALDGGKMDNWVPAHIAADGATNGPYTMGYYTRQDIPFQYALADAFTLFDNYFCSVIGPTGPNRDMWLSGTIDPNGLAGGPSLTTSGPNAEFTWTTYPERLEAAGVSWKFYHEANTATGLPTLNHFTQYFSAQPGNPLFDKAMANSPVGSFEYDVANDQLPTVSWLLPPAGFDEHPNASPAAGATYVASKIDAIAANPEVWAKTVFILSYDENDGFFDHVIPPNPPKGTPDEYVTLTSKTGTDGDDLPVGLGYRVPCIIVVAVDGGRLRLHRAVRPHLPAAVPRAHHGRQGDQHQPVAPRERRGPDFRVPVQPAELQPAEAARHQRRVQPVAVRDQPVPAADSAHHQPADADAGAGPPPNHPITAARNALRSFGDTGCQQRHAQRPGWSEHYLTDDLR